ncbi:MAG: Hsp70 family protein [Candidatus Obscuribacterales bacterium]|nr:Hsp70 family protein [Candidatus Obscuribacterales bacterium]
MPGRIAIDFGNSKTVISVWDPVRLQGQTHAPSGLSSLKKFGDEEIAIIPSLISYGAGGQKWLGQQVSERNLLHSGRTFQWMKRFISTRSSATRNIDDRYVSNTEAAEDFLCTIIHALLSDLKLSSEEEIALTLPIEAFEHYENWLLATCRKAGLKKIRFVDDASAAAIGYGARLFAGEYCLIFDLGSASLNVCLVKQEKNGEAEPRLKVIGKAGAAFGGSTIDEWLYKEILSLNGFRSHDPEIQQISRLLLTEVEALKERLSSTDKSTVSVLDPTSGSQIGADFSRAKLEALLEKQGAPAIINATIERALADAKENGFDESSLKAVLLIGASSQIPIVQELLKERFGKERVKMERPLDAVARGAAAFANGESLADYLQHDYAIRYKNSSTDLYEYRCLVKRGSPSPSDGAVARVLVKAVFDGQNEFMMQVFELAQSSALNGKSPTLELAFDEAGHVKLNPLDQAELESRNRFWINERSPTLLKADPPATKGEDRFEVSFSLDQNRRLLISSKDLRTGRMVHQDSALVSFH